MSRLRDRTVHLREGLLERAALITEASSDQDVRRVYARYRYVRSILVKEATEAGEARRIIRELFADPGFVRFWKIRTARYVRTAGYREWKSRYNQRHYQTVVRAQRSTPEARAILAQRRREQRAAKRGAST
jgi:hypothetical protein